MTEAGKRLERAVRWTRQLQQVRVLADDLQAHLRELESELRQEVREARAAVLLEESQQRCASIHRWSGARVSRWPQIVFVASRHHAIRCLSARFRRLVSATTDWSRR